MERTVYETASRLRGDRDFEAAIASLAALAPDRADFEARFARASIPRIATARYLLREIEHAMRQTGEVTVEGPDRVHVEHIYPQTPAGDRWAHHFALINRIGNLTLLSRRLNMSIKNGDFAAKKPAYEQSDIMMTRELAGLDSWDGEAIDARQEQLSKWIFEIWRFPGEAAPAVVGPGQGEVAVEASEADLEQLPEVPGLVAALTPDS